MSAEGPTLTGVVSEAGECDRCGRELGRIYEVTHPDGAVRTYGRRCCAVVTGYKANHLDRLAAQARRLAIVAGRAATLRAAGHEVPETALTPAEWRLWEILATDSYWEGHDTDGRRGHVTWWEALTEG